MVTWAWNPKTHLHAPELDGTGTHARLWRENSLEKYRSPTETTDLGSRPVVRVWPWIKWAGDLIWHRKLQTSVVSRLPKQQHGWKRQSNGRPHRQESEEAPIGKFDHLTDFFFTCFYLWRHVRDSDAPPFPGDKSRDHDIKTSLWPCHFVFVDCWNVNQHVDS